jgi:hypothetical protein
MYINNFINKKYIALLYYSLNLNKNNSVIVNLKYVKRNKIILLRSFKQLVNFKTANLRALLLKLKKSNIKYLIYKIKVYWYKLNLRKEFKAYLKLLKWRNFNVSLKELKIMKNNCIKNLNVKLKKFKKNIRSIMLSKPKFFYFINANMTLYKFNKKFKLLRFILQKFLNYQVLGNVRLLDVFLKLNLHPLFLKRFKHHFLLFFKKLNKKSKKKFNFNFNNFNLYYFSKVFPKIIKFGSLVFFLSKAKKCNNLLNLWYNDAVKKLSNLINFNIDLKYFNKFKNYVCNLRNINYIKLSFKLVVFKNKNRIKIRRYLRKFKRLNFFNFFNLAFLKLTIFLFLYWFNNIIILFNIKIKGNILSVWFKPISFIFKTYIWRKKIRRYYLKFDSINNYIFLNYKNRLLSFY